MKSAAGSVTKVGLGAVLLALCSWLTVPAPVPFTLQTFGVFFLLLLLGGRLGTASIAVFILLGAAGLPVFSGFQGGLGVLLGPTGGFILGFLLTGLLYRLAEPALLGKTGRRLLALTIGLLLCYTAGALWFVHIMTGRGTALTLWAALGYTVLPYLLPDGLKLALALSVSRRVRRALPDAFWH